MGTELLQETGLQAAYRQLGEQEQPCRSSGCDVPTSNPGTGPPDPRAFVPGILTIPAELGRDARVTLFSKLVFGCISMFHALDPSVDPSQEQIAAQLGITVRTIKATARGVRAAVKCLRETGWLTVTRHDRYRFYKLRIEPEPKDKAETRIRPETFVQERKPPDAFWSEITADEQPVGKRLREAAAVAEVKAPSIPVRLKTAWVTVERIAPLLGLNHHTIRAKIKRGDIESRFRVTPGKRGPDRPPPRTRRKREIFVVFDGSSVRHVRDFVLTTQVEYALAQGRVEGSALMLEQADAELQELRTRAERVLRKRGDFKGEIRTGYTEAAQLRAKLKLLGQAPALPDEPLTEPENETILDWL